MQLFFHFYFRPFFIFYMDDVELALVSCLPYNRGGAQIAFRRL